MTDPLTIIRAELDWPLRYPRVPELTADTELGDWFGPVDRVCVACSLEEQMGFIIPDAEIEVWRSVGDILGSAERGRAVA